MSERNPKLLMLLTRSDLRDLNVTFCNVHLIRLEKEGRFPKRIRLSPYKVAWIESEILDWLNAKAEERDQ